MSIEETYYIDGSVVAPATSGSWTTIANAFDGNTGTFAQVPGGITPVPTMTGAGNAAPTTGRGNAIISSVTSRAFSSFSGVTPPDLNYSIKDSTFATTYATYFVSTGSSGYNPLTTLTPPGGGWTWALVHDIGLSVAPTSIGGATSHASVARVEIIVTYDWISDTPAVAWLKA